MNVKAIVGATTPLIAAVKRATQTIPIIMVAIFDPVGAGLVSSLAHPGGNITGLTFLPGPGLQLELVKQAVPAASHIAMLQSRRRSRSRRAK
jgi:putative ABC transport system substrate-binding protein